MLTEAATPLSVARSNTFRRQSVLSPAARTYLAALAIGLAVALYLVPTSAILATDRFTNPIEGDWGINAIGQRYYLADSWRGHVLIAKNLVPPNGTNVAFMDSIPLLAVPMKVVRRFLPAGYHSVFLWLAICFVLQPVAAVFALRSAGERRFVPGLAVAIISISVPTLLARFGHVALCSHFLILIALGLYFRIVNRPGRKPIVAATLLMLAALFIEPYLMYLVIAVLAAAPITLLVRSDRSWMKVAGGIFVGVVVTGSVALLLGYGHALPMPGYGYYSMNLLSPIFPSGSSFLPQFTATNDATGGQYEGYQYLGLGILLLVLLADFYLGPREKLRLIARHSGIVIVSLALALLALSTKVYVGHHLLFQMSTPGSLLQFRTTGRFFWPVTYLLIIGGTVLLFRHLPRNSALVLIVVITGLQFAETQRLRWSPHHKLRTPIHWAIDTAHLRPLLGEHSNVAIWPKFTCGRDVYGSFLQVGLLASEIPVPVDTVGVGRLTVPIDCTPPLPMVVSPGELLILLPESTPAMTKHVADWKSICRQIGDLVACSQRLRDRLDLPLPDSDTLSLNQAVPVAASKGSTSVLGYGWSTPEVWGVWSDGPAAQLVLQLENVPNKPMVLKVWGHSLAAPPDNQQTVTVLVNGKTAAVWSVKERVDAEYSANIQPTTFKQQPIYVELRIAHPTSPSELGLGADPRKLGFGLVALCLQSHEAQGCRLR